MSRHRQVTANAVLIGTRDIKALNPARLAEPVLGAACIERVFAEIVSALEQDETGRPGRLREYYRSSRRWSNCNLPPQTQAGKSTSKRTALRNGTRRV